MMSPRRKTSEGSFIGVLLPAFYFSAFTDGGFLPSCLSFHSHDLAVIERIWGRLGVLFRAKYHGKGEDWSNQSALRLCLLHVTSQLGEGCSMSFVRCVFLTCRRLVYETVLERFPQWVFGGFKEVWSMFATFLGQRICPYVGELESLGRGWKHKPRAQIKSSRKDSSN